MMLEKITIEGPRPSSPKARWYDDACGTAHALELVGERWSLLIVRELLLGPRRFGDLKASLPGVSANVLTQRLESLAAAGVLTKRRLPPPASVQVYALTDWGMEAEDAIKALGRWAARSPDHDPTLPLSPVSLMMSFRTMFDAEKAADARLEIEFRLGEEAFFCRVAAGELTNGRGHASAPDAIVTGGPEPIAGVVYDAVKPVELVDQGVLEIDGDRGALEQFASFFELPEKAGAH